MGDIIWHVSHCRVALLKLYLQSNQGGLGVPNFEHFYPASQLHWVSRRLAGCQLEDTVSASPHWDVPRVVHLFHLHTRMG